MEVESGRAIVPPLLRVPERAEEMGRPTTRSPVAVPVGGGGARPATRQRTRFRRCGGRRKDQRTWSRCRWSAAGPGRTTSRRAEPHINAQAPWVWRAPEEPEGTGGLRVRPLRAAGSRVAISRAAGASGAQNTSAQQTTTRGTDGSRAGHRPPAHTAPRPQSKARRRPEHQRHNNQCFT